MTVDVTLPDEDAQLYILADCYDTDSCFDDAVADDTFDGDLESIAGWVAPSAGTYFVVVDVYGGVSAPLVPWQFDLSITVD